MAGVAQVADVLASIRLADGTSLRVEPLAVDDESTIESVELS
jgi:hypothetical protein